MKIMPIFQWKWGSRWLPKTNIHKTNEMYMASTRNLRLGPNATYIPLTGVGDNANFSVR